MSKSSTHVINSLTTNPARRLDTTNKVVISLLFVFLFICNSINAFTISPLIGTYKKAENIYTAYQLSDCRDEAVLWEAYQTTSNTIFKTYATNCIKGSVVNILASLSDCHSVSDYDANPLIAYLVAYRGKTLTVIDSLVCEGINSEFHFSQIKDLAPGIYELQIDKQSFPFAVGSQPQSLTINIESKVVNGDREQASNNAFIQCIQLRQQVNQQAQALQAEFDNQQKIDRKKGSAYTKALNELMIKQESYLFDWVDQLLSFQKEYKGTYVADILLPLFLSDIDTRKISTFNEPMIDLENYMTQHYFDGWKFSDSTIINNPLYDMKIEQYLMLQARKVNQDPDIMNKAIDRIMYNTYANKAVEEHTLSYLTDLFLERGPEQAVYHLYQNHIEGCAENESTIGHVDINRIKSMRHLKPNAPATNFQINDLDGNLIDLHNDILDKSEGLTLLIYYGSWCNHCQTEMPKVYELFKQYRDQGLQVVAVSLDDDKGALAKFIDQDKVIPSKTAGWTNLCDYKRFKSVAAEAYFVYGTPMSFLIDKDNKLIGKYKNIDALTNAIGVYN